MMDDDDDEYVKAYHSLLLATSLNCHNNTLNYTEHALQVL